MSALWSIKRVHETNEAKTYACLRAFSIQRLAGLEIGKGSLFYLYLLGNVYRTMETGQS